MKFAERLESSTKHYGVPILMSGSIYRHLTLKTKKECRQVDWVTMAGMDEPIKLFTVDLDSSAIPLDEEEPYLTLKDRKVKRVHDRMKRSAFANAAFSGEFETSSLFTSKPEIEAMRKPYTKKFLNQY